ncbi:MAG: RpiB/LacA/LacB family sugar-phosphate isomerase [Methylotenera sp.]|nr:RpiB/LacA/LacB family sugar-phosphate isomerase [Oligoflexia bacterium]
MSAPVDRKTILIAADHAAVDLKAHLQKQLPEWNWVDLGPQTADRVDYPDFAEKVALKISNGEALQGVLVCGSGIGMCIAANKFPHVRAAGVESSGAAKLSREHNDANVLCLGARLTSPDLAVEIVRTWLETPFSGDLRHVNRIQKISAIESRHVNQPVNPPVKKPLK